MYTLGQNFPMGTYGVGVAVGAVIGKEKRLAMAMKSSLWLWLSLPLSLSLPFPMLFSGCLPILIFTTI